MKKIFAILLFGGGIALSFWSFLQMLDAKASTGWPKVDGEIIGSVVEERVRQRSIQAGVRRLVYQPKVTYRYQVDGTNYEGEKISFADTAYPAKGPASRVQANYPVGRKVQVAVNPDQPSQAVLQPGFTSKAWALPITGLVMIGFGLISILRLVKKRG